MENNLVMHFGEIHVGTTIHNENGEDYVIVAINPKLDRTLLVKTNTNKPYYVGVWYLHTCRSNDNEWCWGQGHYFMDDLEAAIEYVMDIKKEVK